MYYTIYKITNNINGKYYIGKHQTLKLNDNYMGSGKAIKLAIKKHGKENFTKEILFVFKTEQEMNDKEKEIVNESLINSHKNYNNAIGGEGGAHFKGKLHTSASKNKIRNSRKNIIMSSETKKKISESNKKRIITDSFREKMRNIASKRKKSDEEKRKISNARKMAGRSGFTLVS